MNRLSATDRLFVLALAAIGLLAGWSWFSADALWFPFMGLLSCMVAAAILVNLYRYWRACTQLGRRG